MIARRIVLGRGAFFVALIAAAMALAAATSSVAQTPINGLGAMQPSIGRLNIHQMVNYRSFDGDASTLERNIDQVSSVTQVTYGLLSNVAVTFDIPVLFNHLASSSLAPSDEAIGVGDMALYAKWRVWQHDSGPTDTMRVALIGGLQLPGGTTSYWDSTEDGFNPLIGAIFSTVMGRHGFNADLVWEFDTAGGGQPDGGLRYDASYLYRLAPAAYGEETSHAAWYLVGELNGLYETNGNNQLFLAPGIMYEATWFTIDASVGIPLTQELSDRPETEVIVGVGVRIAF